MIPRVTMAKDSGAGGASPTRRETAAIRFPKRKGKTLVSRNYASLRTPGLMALNFFSAVGIVVANKALFRRAEGLAFATSLTGLHFIATALGVRACRAVGVYKVKPLKQIQVLPITVAFCAFVAFNNLSLQYNGVSFYQLMKILTTPAVVVLQLIFFKVVLPFQLLVTLVPICAGVALSTANDTDVSMEGAFWAVAGLLAAAAYQVLVKSTQENLKVSSLQLLHHQAPQAALLILAVSPIFDDTVQLFSMVCSMAQPSRWLDSTSPPPPPPVEGGGVAASSSTMVWAGMVLLSCTLAFLVNLSTFLVIGRTSPVSYQVLGHFKLVVILLVGVAGFGERSSPARLAGMALALAGIIAYTTFKQGLGSGWEGRGGGGGVERKPSGEKPRSNEGKGGVVGPAYAMVVSDKGRLQGQK